jgi:hypothetical protein
MTRSMFYSLRAVASGVIFMAYNAPALSASFQSAKDCAAEYSANEDAIKASKQTKKSFLAACRDGVEKIPEPVAENEERR